eukprot:11447_1
MDVFSIILFIYLYTHASQCTNWLCNQSLWTSHSPVDAWIFESESNITSADNCSILSSSEYAASFLWIGTQHNESLHWRNYRITVWMQLLNGIDAGIVVRASDPTSPGRMDVGQSYSITIYQSSLVIWRSRSSGIFEMEPVVSIRYNDSDEYFLNRVLNITLDIFENRLILYIDTEFVVEYTDNCDLTGFMTGSIGIRSHTSTTRFTHLSVELNPPHIPSQTYTTLEKNEQFALKQIYNSAGGVYWNSPWNLSTIESAYACNSLCGIVCHTENGTSHIISLSLANNNLSGTMTRHIQHLMHLQSIDLSLNHLYGSIPDIFAALKLLNTLDLQYNSLNSTLPHSMKYATEMQMLFLTGNDFTGNTHVLSHWLHSRYLYLDGNAFTGSLPDAFCKLSHLRILDMCDNDFSGSLPGCFGELRLNELYMSRNRIMMDLTQDICQLSELRKIHLNGMGLVGNIPNCVSNMTHVFHLRMMDNALSSSIPSEICELKHLTHLMLSNNNLSGAIPSCIWTKLSNLHGIYLNNNSLTEINITTYPPRIRAIVISDNMLHGSLAPFGVHLTRLKTILFHNNQLDIDLETLFQHYSFFNNLDTITLHDNNFVHQNITDLFGYWLYNLTKIRIVSFANNKRIKGRFPVPLHTVQQQTLTHLVLHGNQLFGSLPINVHFNRLEALSLFDNLLSCTIPSCLVNMSHVPDLKLMVIPSNSFILNVDDTPWMSSSFFTTSHALYNSELDIIKSYVTAIAALLSTAILIFVWMKNGFAYARNQNRKSHFDQTIMQIIHNNGQKYMICIVILVVIYVTNSDYFECVPFLDRLSFSFYFADPHEHGDLWRQLTDSTVCLLWVILCWSVCNIIYRVATGNDSGRILQRLRSRRHTDTIIDRDCALVSSFILWLFLYVYLILLVAMYIISSSLPSDNTPQMSPLSVRLLELSMSVVLTVCNSCVVPILVSVSYQLIYRKDPQQSINFMLRYRPKIIFHLRSFTAVVLPCVLSLWLLHDCGRGWTTFWRKCLHEQSELDISTTIPLEIPLNNGVSSTSVMEFMTINLLKSDDICGTFLPGNINLNKCLRQFSSTWITILIQKVILMHFMPILVIGFKLLRWRIRKMFFKTEDIGEKTVLEIDKEYAMILSKLEIMIVYSWIFPLLIPLTITSITFNIWCYEFIVSERSKALFGVEWILKPNRQTLDFSLSINLLWMSVLIAQVSMAIFAAVIFYSTIFHFCMPAIWIIMDFIFFCKLYRAWKHNINIQIEDAVSSPYVLLQD